jgi:hypothetical protein
MKTPEKDLAAFLTEHKDLVDTVVPTSSGWIIRLSPGFMRKRHSQLEKDAFNKFVSDLEKGWKGSWLGKEANAFFVPRLKKQLFPR